METIGAYTAKTHLPALLKRVVQGETITITRYGQPVALLSPAQHNVSDPLRAIEALKRFRRGRNSESSNPGGLIADGRP